MISNPIDDAFHEALRRRQMAERLGCRPEVVSLFHGVVQAAHEVWKVRMFYHEAREARKEN